MTFYVSYELRGARDMFPEADASVWVASEAVPKKALVMRIEGFPS